MLFERIESKGLAHYSYIIGDKTDAIVIDPRRDCEIYIDLAQEEGMRVAHILETHRNEDYLVGSVELAARTGAKIWHADSQWDYRYGLGIKNGQTWKAGRLGFQAIHTPGHTPGMMNYLLKDPTGIPWAIFTGDTLFAGEVGRIDLLGPDRAPEMAGLLYESIFNKILPLGDEILVCPAHGSGSVCGESIAERVWTTIGLERKHNPRLQFKTREEFVDNLLGSQPERPPYFSQMEERNLVGAPLPRLPSPSALPPKEFASRSKDSFVIDTRMELGFGSGHVPGSQFIWKEGLPGFAGWFVPYDCPILLVSEANDLGQVIRYLIRVGYDNLAGNLSGSMLGWHMAGLESSRIETVTVQKVKQLLDSGEKLWILDARSGDEVANGGKVPGEHHIHVTQVPSHLDEIPKDRKIYVFCGSGMRSMIVASYLERHGWSELAVVLGGMSGWKAIGGPVEE
jgi:hydroxyacylglutathione hydrolase